ncbi:hypothetical protein PV04_04582 [Phialophora macrospora]|uniref:SET domain-containing protein n=1 Tax=Phialophora macrospora TaxID=1851006 RepID=A0A0D2G9N3_9EURO|nr:hypothetical protein PV04_04582 [Phialophora macrospora]
MENLYFSLPSSVLVPRSDVKPIFDKYFAQYAVVNTAIDPTVTALARVTQLFYHGGTLDAAAWRTRSFWFNSHQLPELAAFDGHKAYLLSGGEYQGPLKEDLEEEYDDDKAEAIYALSRGLFYAGCFAEAYLMISLKTGFLEACGDQKKQKLIDLKLAASAAYEQTINQHIGPSGLRMDLVQFMLVPTVRDGRVRVTKYPLIPANLYGLQGSEIGSLNAELHRQSAIPGSCIIRKKTTPPRERSSTEEPGSGAGYSIFVTRDIPQGAPLFSETTRLYSHTHSEALEPCKNCLLDVSENRQADGTFEYRTSFCSNGCARKFTRFVHVPEELFRKVLQNTVQWVRQSPQRHPLRAPGIAGLDADYGGPMYLSYDRHIAGAIDELQRQGVGIDSGTNWDGCVVMDILARVQNSSRAFDVDEVNSFVALTRLFPLIHDGAGNTAFTWKQTGVTATVDVMAKRDLKMGEELFVSPV